MQKEKAKEVNQSGVKLAERGLLWFARRKFEQAIKIDADCYEAYTSLGNYYNEKQNIPEARKCYNKSIELNPAYGLPHYNLLRINREEKRFYEMIANYEALLQTDFADSPEFAEMARLRLETLKTLFLEHNPSNELKLQVPASLINRIIPKFDKLNTEDADSHLSGYLQNAFYLTSFIRCIELSKCHYSYITVGHGQPWKELINLKDLVQKTIAEYHDMKNGQHFVFVTLSLSPFSFQLIDNAKDYYSAENRMDVLNTILLINYKIREFEGAQSDGLKPIIRGSKSDLEVLQKKLVLPLKMGLVLDEIDTLDLEEIYAYNTTKHNVPIFAISE